MPLISHVKSLILHRKLVFDFPDDKYSTFRNLFASLEKELTSTNELQKFACNVDFYYTVFISTISEEHESHFCS